MAVGAMAMQSHDADPTVPKAVARVITQAVAESQAGVAASVPATTSIRSFHLATLAS